MIVAFAGLAVSLSLIVAIGAQNSFVLRLGLRREHVGLVVAICAISDVVLIAAGVAGTGVLIGRIPGLLRVLEVGGIAFLIAYGALALRRAVHPSTLAPVTPATTGRVAIAVSALAMTWLNPGVYLDTVILLGSIANSHHGQAWLFGVGAAVGSVVWFVGLGYGARLLSPLFARPMAWRVLDVAVAVVMTTVAIRLAVGGAFSTHASPSG
jgi:L-lysine exporter family protein LysE/ArgO